MGDSEGNIMRTGKVVESVNIQAPRDEVFQVVVDRERRLQLSPLWGVVQITTVSPDFPCEGSRYHVRLLAEGEQPEYDTIVTAFVPNQKFGYQLTVKRQSRATWTFQDVGQGTRVIYHEEFLVDDHEAEEFIRSVRGVVRNWLDNIKLYAELRGGWGRRLARWLADRYFLRLTIPQRRVVVMILVLHALFFFTLVATSLGLAVARLL
jgi:uncharacterized protein YndB with AHSA1/START domain